MRQIINKYGVHIIIGALVIAALCYWLISPRTSRPTVYKTSFYVDLETGEESVRPINEIAPLPGKSGKLTVVHEIKYSCDGGKTSKPLYYSKFTDAARDKLLALPENDAAADLERQKIETHAELVRSPAPDSPWIAGDDPAADQLRQLPPCPDGATPTVVHP